MNLDLAYPDDEQYWRSVFANKISTPESWIEVSKTLIYSMQCMRGPLIDFWKSFLNLQVGESFPLNKRIHGVYLMLGAYAAENLLKAMLLKQHVELGNKNIIAIPKQIKSHRLLDLAAAADVELTTHGSELLARLSEYAIWAGRYPTPTKQQELMPREISTDRLATLTFWRSSDIRSIDEFISHLMQRLGVSSFLDPSFSGYSAEKEEWESYVAQEQVTPWQ